MTDPEKRKGVPHGASGEMDDSSGGEHSILNTVFETMEDGVNIISTDYRIQYMNRAMKEDIGPHEGERCYAIFHQRSEPCENCDMTRTFAGAIIKREWTSGKSGKTYDTIISPFRNTDGTISRLEIVRDVTERRRTEEALKKSEERYRHLVQHIPAGIYEVDLVSLKFTDVNDVMCEYSGYTREELLSMTPLDLATEEYRKMAMDRNRRALEGEPIPETAEYDVMVKDGGIVPVVVNTKVHYEDGRPVKATCVAYDISDRKRVEKALRESEERYRAMFEEPDSANVYFDREGNIVLINETAAELIGSLPIELVEKPAVDVWPPDAADVYMERIRTVLETGKTGEYADHIVRDGQDRWFSTRAIPIYDRSGTITGIQSTTRDISLRKEAEEQLKSSLREKQVLLREIHHRVKNNMQIINSLLLLQSGYVTDERDRELFEDSQNRIRSLALVHDLLYQSGELGIIDMKNYTRMLLRHLFDVYGMDRQGVRLNMDVDSITMDVDAAIHCGLIINELITNSLKYAFPGDWEGDPEVSVSFACDGSAKGENLHVLIVSDNGIGIPPEIEPGTTKSLGLHLVSILATDQLNGNLTMDRNGGTEFTIRFGVKNP